MILALSALYNCQMCDIDKNKVIENKDIILDRVLGFAQCINNLNSIGFDNDSWMFVQMNLISLKGDLEKHVLKEKIKDE